MGKRATNLKPEKSTTHKSYNPVNPCMGAQLKWNRICV